MRILELGFERYGPFTGCTIHLRPDARVHIVHGLNEAGKSCALAGITDLLFGIETQTSFDFLHSGPDLRLRGKLQSTNGTTLTFKRRKGKKNTLLSETDSPLSDDALAPFIGSLSKDVFCHAFGLNTQNLRQGAEEMLAAGGEIGSSLFAAASGLRGLTDLRKRLDKEAEEIFSQRYSKDRAFYQAHDRFIEARNAITSLQLRSADWNALNNEIDALTSNLDELAVRRRGIAAQRACLTRAQRVAPTIRKIDDIKNKLNMLSGVPETPPDFAESLRAKLREQAEAEQILKDAFFAEKAKQDAHDAMVVNEPLLAEAVTIEELFAGTLKFTQAEAQAPRIQAEADEFITTLKQYAVRLGKADTVDLSALQPTDASRANIRALMKEGRTFLQKIENSTAAAQTEVDILAEIALTRAAGDAATDPSAMREELDALAPALSSLNGKKDLERGLITNTAQISEEALRLHPAVSNLEQLVRVSLPSAQMLSRFRTDLDRTALDKERADGRLRDVDQAIEEVEARLADYSDGGPVPSPDTISRERVARDGAWYALREVLLGRSDLTGAALTEGILSFEQHGAEVDRLTDAAVTDASRVARFVADGKSKAEHQRTRASRADDLEKHSSRETALQGDWSKLWQPLSLMPNTPAEMVIWIAEVQALLVRREKVEEDKARIAQINTELDAIIPALLSLGKRLGLDEMEGISVDILALRIETRLKALIKSWDEARDLQSQETSSANRLKNTNAGLARYKEEHKQWEKRWNTAILSLGLGAGSSIEQTEASVTLWDAIPSSLQQRDNRESRVKGMRREVDEFTECARTLAEEIAPDLLQLPPARRVQELHARLGATKSVRDRRDLIATQLETLSLSHEVAKSSYKDATAAVELLTRDIPPGTNFHQLISDVEARDTLDTKLEESRDDLVAQGGGLGEDQLRAELENFEYDKSEAQLQILLDDDKALVGEREQRFAEHQQKLLRRTALESGVGAELAAQQKRNAEAEMVAAGRQWMILRLSSILLGKAMEHHRGQQDDPLMQRAGEYFATLTGGAFSGIVKEFSDDDTPRLMGCRDGSQTVSIEGMSEGARDQLYLALRLAYLQNYAQRNNRMPFIGDDILTSFDERRTVHGLRALADLSPAIQPILFTHHQHVVDLAQEALGQDVDVVELEPI